MARTQRAWGLPQVHMASGATSRRGARGHLAEEAARVRLGRVRWPLGVLPSGVA
jgi:hypothetical protein